MFEGYFKVIFGEDISYLFCCGDAVCESGVSFVLDCLYMNIELIKYYLSIFCIYQFIYTSLSNLLFISPKNLTYCLIMFPL